MILSYKYSLHLKEETLETINQWLGAQRFVYNYFLNKNKKYYKKHKKFLFYNRMAGILTKLKRKSEYSWLNNIPSQTLQQTLKVLDTAIKDVWKQGKGFPKFRSRYDNSISMLFPQTFTLNKSTVSFPKKLSSLFFKHRNFVGKPKQVRILKENNKYYLIVICEQRDKPKLIVAETSKATGLDMGTVKFFTDSNGKSSKSLNLKLADLERRKKQLQRELDRRTLKTKKGFLKKVQSERRSLTKLKLSKLCNKIKDKRKDILNKLSSKVVSRYRLIVVEDLKVKNMTKSARGTKKNPGKNVAQKKGLNRSIQTQGWSMFFEMLSYKAEKFGKTFLRVPPHHTSQTCSCCGCVSKKNRKSQSSFNCVDCGFKLNADHNAAINILRKGKLELGIV